VGAAVHMRNATHKGWCLFCAVADGYGCRQVLEWPGEEGYTPKVKHEMLMRPSLHRCE